jgi:diguanylate cyclase (GGDEF)-like protein
MMPTLAQRSAWLRTTEFDRNRLLDMTGRLFGATMFASGLCGIAVFTLLGRVGPILLVPLAVGGGGQIAIGLIFPKLTRPERWILAGDCVSLFTICWGVALSGGLESPLLPLLVLPLLSVAGRHTPLTFACFTAITLLAPLLAEVVSINHGLNDHGAQIAADLATIGGAAAIIIALMRAEWHFRHQSLLDPLTGLLNRLALQRRFEELRTQAAVSGGVLSMVIGDVDEFKRINDEHGHDAGDAVLCEIAATLRTNLRSFSLLYRVGGEEFLAVLPGLDCRQASALAERLREAIEGCRPRGIDVTMSFGVACASGQDVDFDSLFGEADRRLYDAKRAGRNRVAPEHDASPTPVEGFPFGADQPNSLATTSRRKSKMRRRSESTSASRASSPSGPNGSA